LSDDLVTAVEFDETGQYLAVGDKAGRICIFEGHTVAASPNSHARPIIPLEYKFYTEFQSHEPEFDCLKSLEIEEKINMIKWGKKINHGLFLLACNDKTIKFWKGTLLQHLLLCAGCMLLWKACGVRS